jgi:acetoin:2,6-dichlorophenolindophenol oxidoreductase subunit beta
MAAMRSYGDAIRDAHHYLLSQYGNVFVIGQGLWAPWYVGNSMKDLDKAEAACTGAALGASLCGYRPIVVHPRVDFMILAIDQIVTQAANWSAMFGGQSRPALTIRGIVNRGGEQGAQHSQALHAWFAHIPGLRVVMPYSAQDARDLLVASVLCDEPVLYIDDRWLYEQTSELGPVPELDLRKEKPKVVRTGKDVTLVGVGYSTLLCVKAAEALEKHGISSEVIDMRVINPLDAQVVVESVQRTGAICAVDGGYRTCGIAGEILARVVETVEPGTFKKKPLRVTLPYAPAPTSKALEQVYYITPDMVVEEVRKLFSR